MPFQFSKDLVKTALEKTLHVFQERLSRIHTGRVNPGLIEHTKVTYQGFDMQLMELASIRTEEARTLAIEPWDKNSITDIEKALLQQQHGAAPQLRGDKLYLTFPPITDETRERITKEVKQLGEEERIKIRQIREDFWEKIKEAEANKEISEDDKFAHKDSLQEVVDEYNKKVEDIVNKKIASLT